MSADPLREPRAMFLAALPFPPMPVRVGKKMEDAMMVEYQKTATSHALFAQMVNVCAQKNDAKFNAERQQRQRRVLANFLLRLEEIGFLLDGEKLYDLYREFTYKHLCTYFAEGEHIDVQFEPLDSITVGDECHKIMVEYYHAQGVIFEELEKEDVSMLDYISILKKCRDRLGKVV